MLITSKVSTRTGLPPAATINITSKVLTIRPALREVSVDLSCSSCPRPTVPTWSSPSQTEPAPSGCLHGPWSWSFFMYTTAIDHEHFQLNWTWSNPCDCLCVLCGHHQKNLHSRLHHDLVIISPFFIVLVLVIFSTNNTGITLPSLSLLSSSS